MEFKDYYRVLGVARDAKPDEIKKAYRKKAREYHPDLSSGADTEAKFKEVNEAYEVLGDKERRATYDQMGQGPMGGQGPSQGAPGWDGGYQFSTGGFGDTDRFSDFFETLFRDRSRATSQRQHGRGADSHARIEISIEDAFSGATRSLTLRLPTVGSDGSVSYQDRKISVHIPKGILAGQHLRVAGMAGAPLGGGPAGDLFLEVTFAPHPVYRVEGSDLYLDLPLAPWEAALGTHVIIPTPGGKVDLRIPKNARSGQKLRLKGKGLPGAKAGDIYATLKIVNPDATTQEARAFFQKMAEKMSFDPRAHLKG